GADQRLERRVLDAEDQGIQFSLESLQVVGRARQEELKLVGRDRERCDLLYLELPLAAERLDPSADADVIPGLDPRVGLLVVIPDPSLDLPAPVTELKPKVGLLLPGPCELFVRDAVARRVARALEEGIQR